jgi:hypothetical protein
VGIATKTVLPGHPDVFMTDNDVQLDPFILDVYADAGEFDGYAHVNADDPRIVVTAMMRCGDNDLHLPVTITSIPAYPVGATAEYFQAGIPPAWTPPIAEPEVPEVPKVPE